MSSSGTCTAERDRLRAPSGIVGDAQSRRASPSRGRLECDTDCATCHSRQRTPARVNRFVEIIDSTGVRRVRFAISPSRVCHMVRPYGLSGRDKEGSSAIHLCSQGPPCFQYLASGPVTYQGVDRSGPYDVDRFTSIRGGTG